MVLSPLTRSEVIRAAEGRAETRGGSTEGEELGVHRLLPAPAGRVWRAASASAVRCTWPLCPPAAGGSVSQLPLRGPQTHLRVSLQCVNSAVNLYQEHLIYHRKGSFDNRQVLWGPGIFYSKETLIPHSSFILTEVSRECEEKGG